MSESELESRFRPMRPASLPRLVLAALLGPLAWALCVLFALLLVNATREIVAGIVVAVISLAIAGVVLLLLRHGRLQEERRRVESA